MERLSLEMASTVAASAVYRATVLECELLNLKVNLPLRGGPHENPAEILAQPAVSRSTGGSLTGDSRGSNLRSAQQRFQRNDRASIDDRRVLDRRARRTRESRRRT